MGLFSGYKREAPDNALNKMLGYIVGGYGGLVDPQGAWLQQLASYSTPKVEGISSGPGGPPAVTGTPTGPGGPPKLTSTQNWLRRYRMTTG